MITPYQVIDEIVDAIEADTAINKLCDQYKRKFRFLVGHLGEESLWQDSTRVNIAIAPSEKPFDAGYNGDERRVLSIAVRIGVYDIESVDDGRRIDFSGVRLISDLACAVAACVRGISGLGDELTNAEMVSGAGATWPLCVSAIDLTFGLSRGLNYEPGVT